MKKIVTVAIVAMLGYFVFRKLFVTSKTEVDDSFDNAEENKQSGFLSEFWNIFRNPPVAQIGSRPLVTASVNPFSGGAFGYPTQTTTLPKFVGLETGASIVRSIFGFVGTREPTNDRDTANEVQIPLDDFTVPQQWTAWENN